MKRTSLKIFLILFSSFLFVNEVKAVYKCTKTGIDITSCVEEKTTNDKSLDTHTAYNDCPTANGMNPYTNETCYVANPTTYHYCADFSTYGFSSGDVTPMDDLYIGPVCHIDYCKDNKFSYRSQYCVSRLKSSFGECASGSKLKCKTSPGGYLWCRCVKTTKKCTTTTNGYYVCPSYVYKGGIDGWYINGAYCENDSLNASLCSQAGGSFSQNTNTTRNGTGTCLVSALYHSEGYETDCETKKEIDPPKSCSCPSGATDCKPKEQSKPNDNWWSCRYFSFDANPSQLSATYCDIPSVNGLSLNSSTPINYNRWCVYNRTTYSYYTCDDPNYYKYTKTNGTTVCRHKPTETINVNYCTYYNCEASCKKDDNTEIDLTSCIRNAKANGVTVNGTKYNNLTYEQAYNYCYINNSCNMKTCSNENEALQTKPASESSIKTCIWNKIDTVLSATNDAALNQLYNECTESLCKRSCFSSSVKGKSPSCTGWYDKSKPVTYNESIKSESSTSSYCNSSPRVSKYGRLIKSTTSCNLFCTQSTNILLPTNIREGLSRLSYFEWPTYGLNNQLRIETTNTCHIFTKEEDKDVSSCDFTTSNIKEAINSMDNPTIKANNITLVKKSDESEVWSIDEEKEDFSTYINKNTNNPKYFTYKTISTYIIPESRNIISIVKSKRTLTKTLPHGIVNISKTIILGFQKLVLTFNNYGFNNQFGSIVNDYTCKYKVVKTSKQECISCAGEYRFIENTNYHDDNNRIKVSKYVEQDNITKVCDYEYKCTDNTKEGLENALKSCVESYYYSKNWKYNVNNINEDSHLTKALNHCSNICNTDVQRVIFREISTSEPFPGRSGKKRAPGTNWIGYENIAKKSDKTKALYEITLTSQNIKNIRNYNKTNDYDDWTLSDTNGRSTFITNTGTTYIKSYKYDSSMKTTQEIIKKCPKTN